MNIYEINKAFYKLEEMAENGEIGKEAFDDTFELLGMEVEDKAVETAKYIKNNMAVINGLQEEYERLKNRKDALEKLNNALKENLQEIMIKANKKKFKTDLFSFNIQKNPVKLIVKDKQKALENGYIKEVEPTVDAAKLKEDIKSGKECDFAYLAQTESLRIR